MALFQVVVPMVVVDLALEDGVGRRELYHGDRFDGGVATEESLTHLVDGGFVEKVQPVDLEKAIAESAKAGDAANPGPQPEPKAPAGKKAPAKKAAAKPPAKPPAK